MTTLDLSTWLLPHHPSPYGHLSAHFPDFPQHWSKLTLAYDHVTTALRVYMRHHPTPNRMPGLAVWLHFQAFAEILTDYAFTSTSPVNIHACLDGISLLVNIAQMLVRIDYRLPFHPRRLRDLPNRVVNLISTVVGQLRKAPPDAVQTALRQGRMSSLLPQLEELVQCRDINADTELDLSLNANPPSTSTQPKAGPAGPTASSSTSVTATRARGTSDQARPTLNRVQHSPDGGLIIDVDELDADDVVLIGGREDWESAIKRMKLGMKDDDTDIAIEKEERSRRPSATVIEADGGVNQRSTAFIEKPRANAKRPVQGDPFTPRSDPTGRLVHRPTEPSWGGRPMGESAKGEWLERIKHAWIVNRAEHHDWNTPNSHADFFKALLEEAKYVSMHNNQPTALFHSIIAVTALCSDHAERLGAMSAIFKANIRFESDEDTVETGSSAQQQLAQARQTWDRDDDADYVANDDDDDDDTSSQAESEHTSVRMTARPCGASQAGQPQDRLAIDCMGTLRIDLTIKTANSLVWGSGMSGGLIKALLNSPANKVPPELQLKDIQLFTKTCNLSELVISRWHQVAAASPNFAAGFKTHQAGPLALSKKRLENLGSTKRPRTQVETIMRKLTPRFDWSPSLDLAPVDNDAHLLVAKVVLALGFLDDGPSYQYLDSTTIRKVVTGPYTTIFKLADGLKVIMTVAAGMLDAVDDDDQRARERATMYATRTWTATQVCLPILVATLDGYADKLKKALVKDPVHQELLTLLHEISTSAPFEQAAIFVHAYQRLMGFREVP